MKSIQDIVSDNNTLADRIHEQEQDLLLLTEILAEVNDIGSHLERSAYGDFSPHDDYTKSVLKDYYAMVGAVLARRPKKYTR